MASNAARLRARYARSLELLGSLEAQQSATQGEAQRLHGQVEELERKVAQLGEELAKSKANDEAKARASDLASQLEAAS